MAQLTCPTRDQLASFSSGRLDEELALEIGTHLDECQSCRTLMETISDAADTLAFALGRPAPRDEFEDEAGLRRAEAWIHAIGRGPLIPSQASAALSDAGVADLGELGHYKLLAKLGQGGMGAVYKALHTSLKKLVALKVLPTDRMRHVQAVHRFRREMEAVGKLNHANIAAAYDAGEVEGTYYLVMELVDGLDLSALVRRSGPLNVPDACELIRQAAVGLQYVHKKGMVHRDIKPSNLMLARTEEGHAQLKILDLGLALLDEPGKSEGSELTVTGQTMGTLDYMAPEQGSDTHDVDIRADIYSLGATLFKLVTGEPPFPSSRYSRPLALMMAKANEPAPSIATKRGELPPGLVTIIDRMLARDPRDRFATPAEVAAALAPFAAGANLPALLDAAVAGSRREPSAAAESPADPRRTPAERPGGVSGTLEFITSDSHQTPSPVDQQPVAWAPPTADLVGDAHPTPSPLRGEGRGEGRERGAGPRWTNRRNRLLTAAAALAGFLLLGGIVLYFQTNRGTVVVEIDDPAIEVTVSGEDILITDRGAGGSPAQATRKPGDEIRIKPGTKTLHVKRGELEFDTDQFTLRRSEKVVLSVRVVEGQVQVVDRGKVIGGRALPAGTDYALEFNGKSDYVDIPSLLYDGSHPITIEAHVSSKPGSEMSVVSDTENSGIALMQWDQTTWGLAAYVAQGRSRRLARADASSNRFMGAERPMHVAGVYDGRELRLFVNGRLERQLDVAGKNFIASDFSLMIGAGPSAYKPADQFFHGLIDEVRISKVARYDKDFTSAERFDPDRDTLALYHFDEGSGDVLHDSSGNGHHGKIVGAKWVAVGRDSIPSMPDCGLRTRATEDIATWQPGAEQRQFLDAVARLRPEDQIEAVVEPTNLNSRLPAAQRCVRQLVHARGHLGCTL